MAVSSAPLAERVSDLPQPDAVEGVNQSPNFLLIVVRRWPLILLGVITGLILGLGYYAQSPPVFESKAQVLVIKRGGDQIGGESARFSYMEDYVGTQQTLIKSQKIMGAAAERLKDIRLQFPLPEDRAIRAEALVGGITVSRDKEAGGSVVGSNVINLAFRSGDPTDTKRILDTIILAYSEELRTVYDERTNQDIGTINSLILNSESQRLKYAERLKNNTIEIRTKTTEEPKDLQTNIGIKNQNRSQLDQRLFDVNYNLSRLDKASNNPAERKALIVELSNAFQLPSGFGSQNDEMSSPQVILANREVKLKTLRLRYGEEHPLILDLKSEIEFLKQRFPELAGDSAPKVEKPLIGEKSVANADSFTLLKIRLNSLKDQLEKRIHILDGQIKEENALYSSISNLVAENMFITKDIESRDIDIKNYKDRLAKLETVRNSGGYSAVPITSPSDGIKVAPRLVQSLAIFIFIGTLLGIGLALAFEFTDKSFRSPAEIRKRLGLPVIGHIPPIRVDLPTDNPRLKGTEPDMEPVIVTHLRPKSIEAEAYRGVRTQLYFSTQGVGHQVIQVTSPNPGDGKSTLAANLAVSIAQSGKRIVLMDCDFRKPRVHKIFHIDKPEVGLASVISGDCQLGEAIRTSEIENLFILPCGPRPQNPAELLTSPEFQTVIDQLRSQYDFVIIDTPPVLAVSDPAVVAPRVDGVLLVFRMTKKARPTAERAREQLGALGANVLGVIVNGTGRSQEDGYGYGYGYNYGYGYQYQYQYEYEYADNYTDDGLESPSSYGELERPELPPAK